MGRRKLNKWTERKIQRMFFLENNEKFVLIVPNIWTPFHGIVDLLCIRQSGYVEDFEIKISRGDFKQDFKHKKMKHIFLKNRNSRTCNRFSFLVPEGLVKPDEVPEYAGLFYINDKGKITVAKTPPLLHKNKNEHITNMKRIARSLMFKCFKYKEKKCQEKETYQKENSTSESITASQGLLE